MFNKTLATLAVCAAGICAAFHAEAAILLFADLTNAHENPPAVPTTSTGALRPASFGTATFLLNDAQTSMSFSAAITNIDFTGLQTPDPNDNLTNAHIHASLTVTPTTNGGVVWGFIGSPFNDNNPNDVIVTPFANSVGGEVTGKWDMNEGNNTTLTAQLSNILNGRAYINFHTSQFGGGEIRGMLTPVPEPATLAMLAVGLIGLLGVSKVRRNAGS